MALPLGCGSLALSACLFSLGLLSLGLLSLGLFSLGLVCAGRTFGVLAIGYCLLSLHVLVQSCC